MTRPRAAFPAFFEDVTGHEPFEWQVELVSALLEGRIPGVMDVPTGFGKTAVISCWAYALAHAETNTDRRLPRRLCFVVDRRLIVDAAYEHADRLASRLRDRSRSEEVQSTARRLAALHADDDDVEPLTVVQMRGGLTWESVWLRRPDQAAVVVGTVDQFGSRLLFRGYGTSPGLRSIDAALVGTDCWLVVDEAHISQPLVETVGTVTQYQQLAQVKNFARPLQFTIMSATNIEIAGRSVLRADPEVQARSTRFPRAAEAARQRIEATKDAALVELTDLATLSQKRRSQSTRQLGSALAEIARALSAEAATVGVVANTVGAARAAHDRLVAAGEIAHLMIGRCRQYERERVAEDVRSAASVGAPRHLEQQRVFVVATQTIEVGADLDFDALVTECAPLSALVQRFGRVRRIGGPASGTEMRSWIVRAAGLHDDDPIYGEASTRTWEYLTERAVPIGTTRSKLRSALAEAKPDVHDFSILGVRELREKAPGGDRDPDETGREAFVPKLLGVHLDQWARTRPGSLADQDPAPFLHGVGRAERSVSVAWRVSPIDHERAQAWSAESNDDAIRQAWQEWLRSPPFVEWESTEVPIGEVKDFLAGRDTALVLADIDTTEADTAPGREASERPGDPLGVVLRGEGEVTLVRGSDDVNVGDRLVIDAALGGHDRWGWTGRRSRGDDPPVPDVADLAPVRRSRAFRLDKRGAVLASVTRGDIPRDEIVQHAQECFSMLERMAVAGARNLRALASNDDAGQLERLVDLLRGSGFDEVAPEMRRDPESWRLELIDASGDRRLIVPTIQLFRSRPAFTGLDAINDDDEGATSSSPRSQVLAKHNNEVGRLASRIAKRCHLSPALCDVVEHAAGWHDLGKADFRFQVMLHDGDGWAAQAARERPLAKSGRDWRDPVYRRAGRLAGLPPSFRHEAVSGRLVEQLLSDAPQLGEGVDVELLHHLVVSHHGHARPVLPPLLDPDAEPVEVEVDGRTVKVPGATSQVDWTHPARFARLNQRFGWWGLAFLETIVRLADIVCSARLEAEEPREEAQR